MNVKKTLAQKLPRGGFARNVVTLMTGTTIAQGITIVISPILTRIYSPEDFGAFAIYISLISVISVIATGRYELAIMLPEKDEEAVNILALSVMISFIVGILSLVLIFIFKQKILCLLNSASIGNWLYAIPLTVFLMGVANAFNYWFNRKKKYQIMAKRRITQSLGTISINLIFGLLGLGIGGLIIGNIVGLLLIVILLSFFILKDDRQCIKLIKKPLIKKQAAKYIDFPRKSTWGSLLNILSGQVPIILMNNYFSTTIVGWYSLTIRVLNSPMNLIGKAVSQVFYERATKADLQGNLSTLVNQTSKYLFILILIPMFILFLFGENIFSLVFGREWEEAGYIAQIFVPFYLVRFIFSSQSTIMMIKRRLDVEIKFNLIFLLSQITSLFIGFYIFKKYLLSFIFMSFTGFLIYLYLVFWTKKVSKL